MPKAGESRGRVGRGMLRVSPSLSFDKSYCHTVLDVFFPGNGRKIYQNSFSPIHGVNPSGWLDELFHRLSSTTYLYNGCLPWYNVVLTSRVHSSVKYSQQSQCGLVRRWNKCVKPLPVVVKVR